MDISRRAFVKATAVALASAAAAGSLASMTGCAGGGSGSTGAASGGEGQKHTAVCRFCGCGCGVICEVKDGKLVSVTGDPENLSNKGLNCVKGYYLGKILYGDDRLTKPLIREDKATKGTDEGLREATWDEALELVSAKLKETWKADKTRLAFWLSGQQPITEGYACAKFIKAGLLSNNVDPNARLCMASAVVGFMNVFQTDEPAGCYADLDNADVFVTWGANMAEAHPMLYSRLTARKLSGKNVKHYDLGTLRTRTSVSADTVMLFKPNTDLAIANCIANYLVQNKKYDEAFVNDHLQFKQGTENIGNATDDGYDASDVGKTVDAVSPITFEEYAARLAPYTFEYTSELSGVPAEDLKALALEFRRPRQEHHVAVDDGREPAQPRHLDEPQHLQHPPAFRQDRPPRLRPVLAHRPAHGLRHGPRGGHVLAPPARRPPGGQRPAPPLHRGHLGFARGLPRRHPEARHAHGEDLPRDVQGQPRLPVDRAQQLGRSPCRTSPASWASGDKTGHLRRVHRA